MHDKSINMDFIDERDKALTKAWPKAPRCAFPGCDRTVDFLPTAGQFDTTCPRHRLLHDYFLYEVDEGQSHPNNPKGGLPLEEYRAKFYKWADDLGPEGQKDIILYMASDIINWIC